jgi:hypothetical protein
VTDVVSYPDGSEAVIIDGAGFAAVFGGRPLVLVGSRLSNGDEIIETLQTGRGIVASRDKPIEGLFDPSYVPPARVPGHRLAVRGSTTANGGVLRKTTGNFPVSDVLGNAGRLDDLIEYPDGSTAMIVSGLGLPNDQSFAPFAIVGSELDNGDVITDSPDRAEHSSSIFVAVKQATLTR